jgi:putative NADH-flavin reductase
MKLVIFGAAGKAGGRIAKEALRRGHRVIAGVRHREQLKDIPAGAEGVLGDPTSPASVHELAPGTDAFVVAIGAADSSIWRRAAETLAQVLPTIPGAPRVVHMGGGSSLLAPDGKLVLDSPDFPATWRPTATGQAEALDFYRSLALSSLNWSYVSPPPIHFAPGERTGQYRTGEDHPVVDGRGESRISYEDFAVAVVDEIERPRFARRRFTVGY